MKSIHFFMTTLLSFLFFACTTGSLAEPVESQEQISIDNHAAAAPAQDADENALPAFMVEDENGKTVSLQSLKGKKVFVNLWASWCPPCRQEMPSIQKLARSVDKAKVAFVMLSLDDHFEKAKAFVRQRHISLPLYYPAENLPALFNVNAIPTTFIFDEDGKLLQRTNGGDIYDTDEYRKLLR